ncbi:uncharacterized protein LOC129915616 [Episyrphus balteatus]|uniref:uncharacterized protein LOC129915616 n=1 Tax=Episyrphus balteatus TaxID=286459 RepID=UPI002486A512|nr:uncharacterized protein LOC129915616 [Episyrphus balteatus]
MKGFAFFLLISLTSSVYCMPFIGPILKQERTNEINDLRKQLEQPENNASHHTLEETNNSPPVEVVETIRAVDLFKAKVSKRIATSSVILHFPGMKTKLLEIAVEKFKACEIARGSNELIEMEHSCLGTATAQMMSLIHAFEKNPSMHF